MSVLIDALQPFITPGLLTVNGHADDTLDELIGVRAAFTPTFDATLSAWEFDFRTPEKISAVMASECGRHGVAAFQSFFDVESAVSIGEHIPWALVRSYYAAYYAAHSILRALGSSCSYVDGGRASILKKVAAAYSISQPIVGGLYVSTIRGTGSVLRFKNINGSFGGTHDSFWGVFIGRLKELEAGVMAGPLPATDAQSVFVVLTRLRELLADGQGAGGNGSWLSSVRNAVQYRHSLDVWFPAAVSTRDRKALARIARGWGGNPMQIGLATAPCGELGKFLSGCTFLVALCRALLGRIGERSSSGKSFVHFGPMRFLATHHL